MRNIVQTSSSLLSLVNMQDLSGAITLDVQGSPPWQAAMSRETRIGH
jgi:hypothetical protein